MENWLRISEGTPTRTRPESLLGLGETNAHTYVHTHTPVQAHNHLGIDSEIVSSPSTLVTYRANLPSPIRATDLTNLELPDPGPRSSNTWPQRSGPRCRLPEISVCVQECIWQLLYQYLLKENKYSLNLSCDNAWTQFCSPYIMFVTFL